MTPEIAKKEIIETIEHEYRPFELLHWCGSVGTEKPTKGSKYRQGGPVPNGMVQE